MGITLATISLENGSPWLAARKTAGVSPPRAKCTATRVARQSTVGPNVWRTRPTKKKPAAKRAEAYYAHNKRRPASNAASLSDHHTVRASNKSDKYDSRSDYSDDEDNFAVAISAAPRKRAKREALPPKKEFTIAMSESDNDTNDNAALANLVSWQHCTPQLPWWGRTLPFQGFQGRSTRPLEPVQLQLTGRASGRLPCIFT